MAITPLPIPVPTRADPINFVVRADAFLTALPTFATEANLLQVDVNTKATNAATSATNSSNSAIAAAASNASAVATAGVTKWVSGTTYAQGQNAWSPINFYTYRRKVAGAGTTDPSLDLTNWILVVKQRETFNIDDYGAVGNGVADDRTPLINVLTEAAGREVVLTSGKTYKLGSAVVYSGDVNMRSSSAAPAVIFQDGQSFIPLTITGTLVNTKTLTASQQVHNMGWAIDSVTGILPGMIAEVKSSALWYHDNRGVARKSELHRVGYTSSIQVYMENPANDGYILPTETVTISFYAPVKVQLTNITVRSVLQSYKVDNSKITGLAIKYASEPRIDYVNVEACANTGIFLEGCYGAIVNAGHTNQANDYYTGYGVQTYGCANTQVKNRIAYSCRRGVDVSGGEIISRHTSVLNNITHGGGVNSEGTFYGWAENGDTGAPQFGYGTHGPADHTVYSGNIASRMHNFIVVRGRNEYIDCNYFIGRSRGGAISLSYGENVTITNNQVYMGIGAFKNSDVVEGGGNINTRRCDHLVEVHSTYQGGSININNNSADVQESFLYFDTDVGTLTPPYTPPNPPTAPYTPLITGAKYTICRNTVMFATQNSTDPVALVLNGGATFAINASTLLDNDLRRESGTGTVSFLSNLTLGTGCKTREI